MMKDDVIKRLKSFGYIATFNDLWVLDFIIQKVQNHICNFCNITKIPDELHYLAVNMICGEFLYEKKAVGQLEGFDLDTAIKEIKEGDTTVVYAVGDASLTAEQRLNGLIQSLMNCGVDQLIRFRCFQW